MEVRERIRVLRQRKNLSTYELAGTSGLHQSSISRIETGQNNIMLKDLIALSKGMDVPIEAFFSDDAMLEAMQ